MRILLIMSMLISIPTYGQQPAGEVSYDIPPNLKATGVDYFSGCLQGAISSAMSHGVHPRMIKTSQAKEFCHRMAKRYEAAFSHSPKPQTGEHPSPDKSI